MTAPARPRLTLDDPLAGRETPASASALSADDSEPAAPTKNESAPSDNAAWEKRRRAARKPPPPGEPVAATRAAEDWRDWSGRTRVTSFRLPDELLDELGDRTARLGLPIGQTVLAALAALLDRDDAALIDKVDRAAQALAHGKRRARQQRAEIAS